MQPAEFFFAPFFFFLFRLMRAFALDSRVQPVTVAAGGSPVSMHIAHFKL